MSSFESVLNNKGHFNNSFRKLRILFEFFFIFFYLLPYIFLFSFDQIFSFRFFPPSISRDYSYIRFFSSFGMMLIGFKNYFVCYLFAYFSVILWAKTWFFFGFFAFDDYKIILLLLFVLNWDFSLNFARSSRLLLSLVRQWISYSSLSLGFIFVENLLFNFFFIKSSISKQFFFFFNF